MQQFRLVELTDHGAFVELFRAPSDDVAILRARAVSGAAFQLWRGAQLLAYGDGFLPATRTLETGEPLAKHH